MAMSLNQGRLFMELMANSGWLDAEVDLLDDMLTSGVTEEEAREKAQLIDSTVAEINAMLPVDEQTNVTIEKTLDRLLNR